jgi:hypothetical protein
MQALIILILHNNQRNLNSKNTGGTGPGEPGAGVPLLKKNKWKSKETELVVVKKL